MKIEKTFINVNYSNYQDSSDNFSLFLNNTCSVGFSRSGGTGRRAGFKIPSWQQGEGSTPSFGINDATGKNLITP